MTPPTRPLAEVVDEILAKFELWCKDYYENKPYTDTPPATLNRPEAKAALLQAFRQLVEEAKPEKLTTISSKTPEINGYNQGLANYHRDLLERLG